MSREILKGVHRRALGIGHSHKIMARDGLEIGGSGRPSVVLPGPDVTAIFDDFHGVADTGVIFPNARYNDIWMVSYSDTGQLLPSTGPATQASGLTNGVFRLT